MEFKSPLSHQSAVKMFTALFCLISFKILVKQALFVIFVCFVILRFENVFAWFYMIIHAECRKNVV